MASKETLYRIIKPCGPVIDGRAGDRAREALETHAAAAGWSDVLTVAWPALVPIFSASPYLAALATREPDRLRRISDEHSRRVLEHTLGRRERMRR